MSDEVVFGAIYSHHYDEFYAGKDYEAECDFVETVFGRHSRESVQTVLDLGCGTGGHALVLAQRGYMVVGVDRSEAMLQTARVKASAINVIDALTLHRGDIRTLELAETYDAVIAMFAVMSYMTTNADLAAALHTARQHLRPGGLLVFDAWYGPGVLTERPAERYRLSEVGDERTIRLVRPDLDVLEHTVDVFYKVMCIHGDRIVEEVDEVHRMRFLFAQELRFHLECAGFRVLTLCPFLDLDGELTERSWNVAVVAQAA